MTLLHSIRADPKERALLEASNKRLSIEATYAGDLAEERAQRLRAEAEREEQRRCAESERTERERAEAAAEALCAKLRDLGIAPDAAGEPAPPTQPKNRSRRGQQGARPSAALRVGVRRGSLRSAAPRPAAPRSGRLARGRERGEGVWVGERGEGAR